MHKSSISGASPNKSNGPKKHSHHCARMNPYLPFQAVRDSSRSAESGKFGIQKILRISLVSVAKLLLVTDRQTVERANRRIFSALHEL